MDAAGISPPSSSRPLRFVICPWLGFGHMLPYLELAERLASRGHRVSFVSTPRNLARLPPLWHAVELVPLPLPRVEGLPDGAESTNDVPGDRREPLWEAFDGLAAPFAEYLAASNNRPDWILADTFHHWAAAVAREHKVPCALLMPSAALMAALASGSREQQPVVGMPRYERERIARQHNTHGASGGMSTSQRIALTVEGSTITAIRSCPEWEHEVLPLAAKLHANKPLVPLGLLPPSPDGGRGAALHRDDDAVRWLDAQPAKSVVYVALGSEVPLPVHLVHELAHGLELAGTRFLWALRKPAGVPDTDVLPPGFLERTHGYGMVAMGWVPQVAVLSHASIGAFLTHCGRNSLIEGLMYGHPLIMLPIFGDQGPNARLMAGKKVGLLVPRNEDDGSFDRHGIESTVQAVMVEEGIRKVLVANAMKMQEIVVDKELHERYIDEFVQKLRSYITDGDSSTAAAPPQAET